MQVTAKVYSECGKILEDTAYACIWLSADETTNVQRHTAHIIVGKLDPNKPP
jgi:hypothetical protein